MSPLNGKLLTNDLDKTTVLICFGSVGITDDDRQLICIPSVIDDALDSVIFSQQKQQHLRP